MKNQINIRHFFLVLLSVFCITTSFAQKKKKDKVRLKAQYVKIMDGEIYFDISAGARVNRKNIDVANIDLTIFNKINGKKVKFGKTTTNMHGKSKFILKSLSKIEADSTNTYNFVISFKGNESFKKASKSISFKDANIEAKLVTKDSINYITATLIDKEKNRPISDVILTTQIQRLFKPLKIGDEFNNTDKNGTISVIIEEGIPGVDGNLAIEVVLIDSDVYGTVKAIVNAPIGKPIVDESTFDQRTMWSPRNKTPLFLLIFPNLLIISVWGLIIYLILNLVKLKKS